MSEAATQHRAPVKWRQVAGITAAAVAIFIVVRLLPTGTNLSHMDFRVAGRTQLEFCDPANPQFIPVVAVRSPVILGLEAEGRPTAGKQARFKLTMRTASGKPIVPVDLLVVHTKLLHLLIVDPTLTDYQHVHPVPQREEGTWTFAFTPRHGGTYRVFADFTPAATGRSLYASAEVAVAPGGLDPAAVEPRPAWIAEQAGYRFALTPGVQPLKAGQPADLRFVITRVDGGAVSMEPVMGAFAHLVAFDKARSGFAHLHPRETDLLKPLDPQHPTLNFRITIPRAGRYVIWAQVKIGGRERFAPFWFEVTG